MQNRYIFYLNFVTWRNLWADMKKMKVFRWTYMLQYVILVFLNFETIFSLSFTYIFLYNFIIRILLNARPFQWETRSFYSIVFFKYFDEKKKTFFSSAIARYIALGQNGMLRDFSGLFAIGSTDFWLFKDFW
jgi:hypothetical protein